MASPRKRRARKAARAASATQEQKVEAKPEPVIEKETVQLAEEVLESSTTQEDVELFRTAKVSKKSSNKKNKKKNSSKGTINLFGGSDD